MAKIVETKLVFSGDDQVSSKIKTITQAVESLGSAVAIASEKLSQMTLPTGAGGGGGRGAGRPRGGQGSPRSPYAPPPPGGDGGGVGGRGAGRDYQIPRGGQGSPRSPYTPPPPGGGGGGGIYERGGTGYGGKPYMGWRGTGPLAAGLGGAGQLIGAGQTLLGGVAGNLTATAGGMLMTAGGAITGIAGGAGVLLGGPMMAAGGLMGLSAMLAQPALQHYGTHAGIYRRLGEERTRQFQEMFRVIPGEVDPKTGKLISVGKAVGPYAGIFNQDEAIQYAGQLESVGGFNALGTMAGMRRGGFEPETMIPFFQTATTTGAAGARGVSNYEFLGKVITKAFKDSGMASMGQAIETMTGVMQISSQYLADISDTDTKSLAAFVKVGELSGTAALRGQRGVQVFGGITGGIAKAQDPAMQMLLWNIFSKGKPGMSFFEMEEFKQSPQAVPAFLKGMSEIGNPDYAAYLMYSQGMVSSFPIAKKVIAAYGGGDIEAAEKTLSDEELKNVRIAFGAEGGEVGKISYIQESKNLVEQMRLEISAREGIVANYQSMEESLMLIAASMLDSKGVIAESMTKIAKGLAWMATQIDEKEPTTGFDPATEGLLFEWYGGETLTREPWTKRGPV